MHKRTHQTVLVVSWVALCAAPMLSSLSVAADAPNAELPVASAELLLEVEINGVLVPEPALVRNSLEGPLLRLDSLESWGIRLPDATPTWEDAGERFVRARSIQGLRARIDFPRQRLLMVAAPSLLPPQEIHLADSVARNPEPSVPGAVLRYDFYGTHEERQDLIASQFGLASFAGAWRAEGDWQMRAESGVSGTRLDTALTRDWPDRALRVRLGDTITSAADWSSSLRVGGLHWGTEFRTRPDVITFPLPAVRGEAVVPSTADVYVNGVLRSRTKVEPGPFTLHDLPVISGGGDVRLVVRDALGREQVVSQPYLVSEGLLRPGLLSYSVDVGAVREDYGLASFEYGRPITVIDVRRGMSDSLTIEGTAEGAENQQTVGFGLTGALHPAVLLSAAVSHSEADQSGDFAQLGLATTGRALNAGIRLRLASEGFRQLGMLKGSPLSSRSIDGQIGWQSSRFGSVGLVFANRALRNEPNLQMLTATYGIALGPLGYLSAFATRSLSEEENLQVALVLTRALGDRTAARVAASVEDGGFSAGASLSRSLPAEEGSGFHLETEHGVLPRIGAGYSAQSSALTVMVDGERRGDLSRLGAGAHGGLVMIGGHASAVRDPGDDLGIALVEVPGQPGVTIYHDNHRAARTDAQGFAMVTGLRPYEVNRLRIDAEDLPIDVATTNEEIRVRPYSGGGVQIRFPEAQAGGATLRLLRPSGEPVPAGAKARVGTQEFTVAGSGILYVTGVSGNLSIKVTWSRGSCYAQASIPVGPVLPDLGPVMCGEII